MSELISASELSRRLGVTPKAVTRALESQRITLSGRKPNSGKALFAWPDVRAEWDRNTQRQKYDPVLRGGASAPLYEPPSANDEPVAPAGPMRADPGPLRADPASNAGGVFHQARAQREAYGAKLAKLQYEERLGKLIPSDDLERTLAAQASAMRSAAGSAVLPLAQQIPDHSTFDQRRALIQAAMDEMLHRLATEEDIPDPNVDEAA